MSVNNVGLNPLTNQQEAQNTNQAPNPQEDVSLFAKDGNIDTQSPVEPNNADNKDIPSDNNPITGGYEQTPTDELGSENKTPTEVPSFDDTQPKEDLSPEEQKEFDDYVNSLDSEGRKEFLDSLDDETRKYFEGYFEELDKSTKEENKNPNQ